MPKTDTLREDWMSRKWRPMMAIMYMLCCVCDFILFPVMFTIVQFWENQPIHDAFRQWAPITLQGGGLFHIAMGAVLGVSAYGRTQEKLGSVNSIVATPVLNTPASAVAPIIMPTPIQKIEPVSAAPIIVGFGGKPAPLPAPQPLI